jgi:hypothetical protein
VAKKWPKILPKPFCQNQYNWANSKRKQSPKSGHRSSEARFLKHEFSPEAK